MALDSPGYPLPANGGQSWSAAITEWVVQLIEPLVPTGRRVATEERLVRCASAAPGWAAIVLGGVIADLIASVPGADPVRNLGARLGPLRVIGPAGDPPDSDGVSSASGVLPAGFEIDFSSQGIAAQSIFGEALPAPVQATLALVGAAASGVPSEGKLGSDADWNGPVRTVELGHLGSAGPWSDVFDHPPVSGVEAGMSVPWLVATAALLVAHRRGQLDDENLAPLGAGGALSAAAGGRALAVTGAQSLRWALWNRREYLGPTWPSDRWPARSAVRWSAAADLAMRGIVGADEHWGLTELAAASVWERGGPGSTASSS